MALTDGALVSDADTVADAVIVGVGPNEMWILTTPDAPE